MTEKVLVLAGGRGTRLKPLTDTRPKPNVYLGASKRMLEYTFDRLVAADYRTIHIAVEHMGEKIEQSFGDGSHFQYTDGESFIPVKLVYARATKGKMMRNDADGLRKARPYMADGVVARDLGTHEDVEIGITDFMKDSDRYALQHYVEKFDHIVVCNGDVLHNFDISSLVRFHRQRGGLATMALYKIEDPEKIKGNFGTVIIDNHGKILRFDEKPKTVEDIHSDLINTGIYVFSREILDLLDRHDDMVHFGTDVFPELLSMYKDGSFGLVMPGYWNDVGTIESYRATNMQLIDGIHGIESGSYKQRRQKDNQIRGATSHSIFGQGCVIENGASVENSVLGNDVYVGADVHLDRCVVLSGSKLESTSIIGKGVIIDGIVKVEKGATVGDNVVIGKEATIKSGAVIRAGAMIGSGKRASGEVNENMLDEE